jgi:hypothetical protein
MSVGGSDSSGRSRFLLNLASFIKRGGGKRYEVLRS